MKIANKDEGKPAKKAVTKKTSLKIEQPSALKDLEPLQLKEMTEILIRHYKLKSGLYDLLVEFQVGVGGIKSPSVNGQILPGAVIGVSKIGLLKAEAITMNTVDASKVK